MFAPQWTSQILSEVTVLSRLKVLKFAQGLQVELVVVEHFHGEKEAVQGKHCLFSC